MSKLIAEVAFLLLRCGRKPGFHSDDERPAAEQQGAVGVQARFTFRGEARLSRQGTRSILSHPPVRFRRDRLWRGDRRDGWPAAQSLPRPISWTEVDTLWRRNSRAGIGAVIGAVVLSLPAGAWGHDRWPSREDTFLTVARRHLGATAGGILGATVGSAWPRGSACARPRLLPRPRPLALSQRATRPRRSSRARAPGRLPPDRITPTRRPSARTTHSRAPRVPARRWARRPACMRSHTSRMARLSSTSGTDTMSSTARRISSKVSTPSDGVRAPSAMVSGCSTRTRRPARNERAPSSPRGRLHADHATRRRQVLAACAEPEINPPPPTGTSSRSSGPTSSISAQRRSALAGAMTSGWSNGGTIVSPRSRGEPLGQGLALFTELVVEDHLGAIAARGVELGARRRSSASRSSRGAPSRRPTSATACAWFPKRRQQRRGAARLASSCEIRL